MNVYDFDKTIFPRDSSLAFYFYCLRRRPRVLRRLPGVIGSALSLAAGRIDLTAFKERFFSFLADLPEPGAMVEAFWQANLGDVHRWYLRARREDDLVISASPDFLVRPACRLLGVTRVIASPVDPRTGRFLGPNCRGAEKVRALRACFPDAPIDRFYSDSRSDAPLAALAKSAFLVRGERVEPW